MAKLFRKIFRGTYEVNGARYDTATIQEMGLGGFALVIHNDADTSETLDLQMCGSARDATKAAKMAKTFEVVGD